VWILACCSIYRSWICRKCLKKFGTCWDRLSDNYYSDRVDSVIVIGCLHLTFILQGGLDRERIGGFRHLLIVVGEHRGL
jgi:hypothetical protein